MTLPPPPIFRTQPVLGAETRVIMKNNSIIGIAILGVAAGLLLYMSN